MKNFRSIQSLRAVAATMVVIFHSIGRVPSGMLDVNARPPLAAGVDIFFVISGFVMVISTTGRAISPQAFMRARIIRVVPMYWICTLTLVALASAHWVPVATASATDLIRSLLFIPYTNSDTGYSQPYLSVGWTLNYEMVFYVFFASTMSFSPVKQFWILAVLFFLKSALRPLVGEWGAAAFHYTSPLSLEFVAGMALANCRHKISLLSEQFGVALVILGFALLSLGLPFPRFIGFGIPSVIVVLGAIASEPLLSKSRLLFISRLGDASYSLYLVHPLVIGGLESIGLLSPPTPSARAIACGASLLAAFLLHFYIETPLTRWLQRLARP